MIENKDISTMSNASPIKMENILSNHKDNYDNKKYSVTKINTKINNNSFNIFLLDKKINKKFNKKQSFSNLSVTCSFINDKNDINKEIKSENNFEESKVKLNNKINGLFFDKNRIKKISPEDIKLDYLSDKNRKNSINNDNNIINTNHENKEEDLSDNLLNENIKIDNSMNKHNKINEKENNKKINLKLKASHSFTSFPIKYDKEISPDNGSNNNEQNKLCKKKSIISQDYPNTINKKSIFSSINELLNNSSENKYYNFNNKENKRYKNIQEIKDDQNYFRLLYLSSNLIDILKTKEILKNEENDESMISDINNQNYYIYTNDRKVLKLISLFFKKVHKAIYLFNTEKYENAYKSLIDDKIIKNKNMFALFLLTTQGIDKEKLYFFLSKNVGINTNFSILKNFLGFFDFSFQTIIVSFNFLLETIFIPSKNNNAIISLFADAFIRDNPEMVKKDTEISKNEIKNICGLILKLNHIMCDPDGEKHKNKEEFINSNINDTTTNWNPDLNHLISNDPSTTVGLIDYSHVCGYVYDEYIKKNENFDSQKKNNQRDYNELLYKKLLVNKSFSFQNSLIKNEINNINSNSNLIDERADKKKKISIIANKRPIFRPSKKPKNLKSLESQIKQTNDEKDELHNQEEKGINSTLIQMKKGEKISKIININSKTVRIIFSITHDENNIVLIKDICCERKEIISIDDISECTIGYSQNLKTNKSFENYMSILLKTEQIYEFYHPDKKLIENLVNTLGYLIKKRNKVLTMLNKKEKISEEKISNIWETIFLNNWSYYRKFIIKKKNRNYEYNTNNNSNSNNNKENILKIWSLGLPFWLRANMWKLVIPNDLNITEVLFQGYFQLVTKEQERYNNLNKKKQNISFGNNINNISNIESIEENFTIIETISKDCKKIIKRIKNILSDIPDKLPFINVVYKIIRSFCLYRPDLLYSKNISELAIFFYINCNMNDYDTFTILCNFIINNYFFKHIQNDRIFMKNQLKFFGKLIEKYLPLVHNHFKELQFNTNIFFYKWIEFLFLKTLDYKICLRIFDNFILKGEIFIFEVSIAILNLLKKDILNSDENGLVYLLKKNYISINEDDLFKNIDKFDIKKEYNDYFNVYIIGKEKIELFQDL